MSIWLSVDPLSDKYPGISAYSYCFNNPIIFIDKWGLEGETPEQKSKVKQTDFSKIEHLKKGVDPLNNNKTTLNIMVMGNGTNRVNTDPSVDWSQGDKENPSTFALYVNDITDFKNQVNELTSNYNVDIGNVFISSHGDSKSAKTFAGKTPITSDNIAFLKDFTSSNSILFLLSCNAGNPEIGGFLYLQGIAQSTGTTVIGCQVRVGLGASPGQSIYDNSTRGYDSRSPVVENWEKKSGKFTIATSNSIHSTRDVRISSSGQVMLKHQINKEK